MSSEPRVISLVAIILLGCSSRTLDRTNISGADGGSGDAANSAEATNDSDLNDLNDLNGKVSDAGTAAGGGLTGAAACAAPDGPAHPVTAQAELAKLVVGRWLICSGPGFLWGTVSPQKGLELDADGNFFLLGDDGSGNLIRGTGFFNTGTWMLNPPEEDGGYIDLNVYLHIASGDGASFYPAFEDLPRKMLAGGDSGNNTLYVPTD